MRTDRPPVEVRSSWFRTPLWRWGFLVLAGLGLASLAVPLTLPYGSDWSRGVAALYVAGVLGALLVGSVLTWLWTRARSDELEESRARLAGIVNSAMDAIITVDQHRHVTFLNRAAQDVLRCDGAEAIGSPLERFIPEVEAIFQAEWLRTSGAHGVLNPSDEGDPRLVARRADGETFPIEATFSVYRVHRQAVTTLIVRDVSERHERDAALRESETRYRSLVDSLKEVIFQADLTGRWIFLNPAWSDITGHDVGDSVGRPVREFIHPDDRDLQDEKFERLRDLRDPVSRYEVRCERPDGILRWLEVRARPSVDATGNLIGISGTLADITERREVEEALVHSQARLKLLNIIAASVLSGQRVAALIEGTVSRLASLFPDCRVAYATVDNDGRMVVRYARQPEAMRDHTGAVADLNQAPEYMSALRAREPVVARNVAEDRRLHPLTELFDARLTGGFLGMPLHHSEQLIGLLSLESPDSRQWAEHELTTLRAVAETLSVAVAEARTRLEREAAQHALRRSEASLRGLVDNAVFGIFRSTVSGRLLMVNRTLVEMLGYESPEELLAVDVSTELHASPEARVQLMGRLAASEGVHVEEVTLRRKDGSPLVARLSGRTLRSASGAAEGLEVIVEDVTERKTLEEQLRHSQKLEAIGRLTGGIAHDFNNLLTVIQFNAEMVGEALPARRKDLRAKLQALQNAAKRGTTMIRKLLAFSRRERLELRPLDLSKLVSELSGMIRHALPESIEIQLRLDEELPAVQGEADAIEQILLNLVTNARDAMGEGGTLTLETGVMEFDAAAATARGLRRSGGYVRLSVRDTGSGIDETVRAQIFEPFFTTKPTGMGTGLGLSMVYGLVHQHGGFVDVESTDDEGTTIAIYLPAVEGVPAQFPEGERGAVKGGNETILVAEDEPGVRGAAKDVLEWNGYTVLQAVDGREALELYRLNADRVDLIISDVVMPQMGGQSLYEALRSEGATVRMLFTSGYAARDAVSGAELDTSVPFLRKPWTPRDLLARVREVLDSSPAAAR